MPVLNALGESTSTDVTSENTRGGASMVANVDHSDDKSAKPYQTKLHGHTGSDPPLQGM
jgi:hypothetical protein